MRAEARLIAQCYSPPAMTVFRLPPAARLLLVCLAGSALVQIELWRAGADNPFGFSAIFWYLLKAYDTHGNELLLAAVVLAFLLRRRAAAIEPLLVAAQQPWRVAAVLWPLLCLASLAVYRST